MFMSLVPGATFQCGRKNIFKNIFFNIFAHKKLKKPPQKVAYLWQLGGFFLCSPDCPKQPRTSFPLYKFFYPTISSRISASSIAAITRSDPQWDFGSPGLLDRWRLCPNVHCISINENHLLLFSLCSLGSHFLS